MDRIEAWYLDFEKLNVTGPNLIKLITDGHESQDELKAKYDALIAQKTELRLKFEDGGQEARVLNKIQKWNQVAIDCRKLVSAD